MTLGAVDTAVGFGCSAEFTFTIANGATTRTEIDLGRNYAWFVVRCEDVQYAASKALTCTAAMVPGETMTSVYERNDPATKWSKNTPASGSFRIMFDHAFGARFLKFTLGTAASGGAFTLYIRGMDPIAE